MWLSVKLWKRVEWAAEAISQYPAAATKHEVDHVTITIQFSLKSTL